MIVHRPPRSALVTGALAGVVAAIAVVGLLLGWDQFVVGALLGAVLVVGGAAFAMWAHASPTGDTATEEREQKGPDQRRRRILLGMGAGAVAVTAGAIAVPAAARVERATRYLRTTAWRDGVRAVDPDGVLVVADEVAVGELLTVYPEGHVGEADSQAVLIREDESRFPSGAARESWHPGGLIVFSKLCTHMACPLGLYQQQTATLLCPCHQAAFDVLDDGRAVAGPARRPLPQLPIRVDDDGFVVALGDFTDAVGTGFWGRP